MTTPNPAERGAAVSPRQQTHSPTRRSRGGRRGRRLLLGLALAAALAPVAGARTAHAAAGQTYVVTDMGDPASCPDASGLSLRCAVAQAQADGGQDTITFNLPNGSMIPLLRTLVINEPSGGSLTIQGPGAGDLFLDGLNRVQDLSVSGAVTLAGLTVADGLAQGQAGSIGNGGGGGGGAAGLGGGLIVNGGHVTIAGVTFTGNSAVGGGGGESIPGIPGGVGGSGGGPAGGPGGIGVPIGPGGQPGLPGGFASGGGGGGSSGGDPTIGPFPIMFPGGFGGSGGFGGGGGGGGALGSPGGISLGDMSLGGVGGPGGSVGGGGGGGGAGLGGAIFVQQGALTVNGSTFRGNNATGGAGGVPIGAPGLGEGGAIYAYQGSVTVDTCTTFADSADTIGFDQAAYLPGAPCTTSTQLTSAANPSTYGQAVTLTAQVAAVGRGIPIGSVTFYDGSTSLGTATLDDSGAASLTTSSLGAGAHSITAVYGRSPVDTGSTSAPLTQQVDPAPLTITANDQNMTYGGSVPTFDASYSGLVNGDTSGVVSGLACGATDDQGHPVSSSTPAGTDQITCSGGSAANYAINYQPGTLTISPAPLTITANDKSMTYGGTLPTFDASYSGFVAGDSAASLTTAPTCTTSATNSSPVSSYAITCSGAVDPNYAISYQPGTLTVTQASLTITASSPSVVYDGTVPAITPGYSGFVNGDSAANLSTAPTCTSTAPSDGAAGAYQTSCSGAADPNYTIGYQAGTLTIAQAPQAISFGPLAGHQLGDAPITVAATGGASGNPVTFSAGPNSVCTSGGINGATITLVGAGTCTVTADQAGNGNYLPAPSVAQSFAVSYPPLSLALGVSSSPAGPVTTGSVVTASMTLTNHTSATQTVNVKATLTYTGSGDSQSLTIPLKATLGAGQTLAKSATFTISRWFPRGAYTLRATATDGSGDSASSSATLTVS